MNQVPQHPKLRGEWAEIQFLARASEHGLHVSKPYGDCLPYDFIVEHAGRMLRVQVKSTSYQCPGYTGYKCFVKPSPKGKHYAPIDLDFVAAWIIPEDVWYILPFPDLASKNTVHLDPANPRNRYREFREAWHLLLAPEARFGTVKPPSWEECRRPDTVPEGRPQPSTTEFGRDDGVLG